MEHPEKANSTTPSPDHHSPSPAQEDDQLNLYREPRFPYQLLEGGWPAPPDAWEPPSHLKTRVMDSFQRHHERGRQPWLGKSVRLSLPLAAAASLLVLTLAWFGFRDPEIVLLQTTVSVPGPVTVLPSPLALAGQPLPAPAQPKSPGRKNLFDRKPIMRGESLPALAFPPGLERVRLAPGALCLLMDEVVVARAASDTGGTALWVRAGAAGSFVLTLFPTSETGSKPLGTLEENTFRFFHSQTEYRIECERPLLNKGTPFPVWVRHFPPSDQPTGLILDLGCAETPLQAVERLDRSPEKAP